MIQIQPKLFVDFDGTISLRDVGNEFFRRFGNEEESLKAVAEWKAGELSGRELTVREAEFVKVTERDALDYIQHFQIDSRFRDFVDYCKSKSLELTVLSDGLDFYIDRIFESNAIADVPFFSNHVRFDSGSIRIDFPFESDCTKCGNCKGRQILTRTGIDDIVIYVGNGFSDRCAVKYADVIFAKDELLRYCEENNITFFPFTNFGEVIEKLDRILANGKLRKRPRAELMRREAFLSE